MFQLEEENVLLAAGNDTPQPTTKPTPSYNHSGTRLSGNKEGLLVDTGAVQNLTGGDFVARVSVIAEANGRKTSWHPMTKVKHVSGVGDAAKACYYKANVPGMMKNGREIRYVAPVISGEPSPCPPLYGLDSMKQTNTYMGTKYGRLAMVPEGSDDQIIWPEGTEFIQCEASPSGHWMIVITDWGSRASSSRGEVATMLATADENRE